MTSQSKSRIGPDRRGCRMHRSEKRTIRIVASLSMALGACREGTAPMSPSFSGDYTVSVARFPAACTPQSLPEPVSTDTSQYADVPTRRTLTDAAFRVNVVNSSISIAGLDDNGRPDPMRTSAGTIVGDIPAATSVTSRSVPSRREGLRQGSSPSWHRFRQAMVMEFKRTSSRAAPTY